MRKSKLYSATALTLVLATAGTILSAQIAFADTTISTDTTTPVSTSTTGNLTLSGKITLTSGTAITVNSANTVAVSGSVVMSSSDPNSTAILVNGGQTTGISLTGSLTVTDSFTAVDTNADGVIDYPFAQGDGRYGIRSTGSTPLIGNVSLSNGSTITVEGNNSYGVRLQNALQGTLESRSTINVTGDNSKGVSIEGGVTGRVRIGGSVSAFGEAAKAVDISSKIDGALIIDGAINSNAYSVVSPSTLTTTVYNGLVTGLNKRQAGVAVDISDSVTGGILLNAAPVTSTTVTDNDGDGTLDTEQSTGTIAVYGSAPALRIASATKAITINKINVASTATATTVTSYDKYGLVLRGTISASGIYSGVDSTAVELAGLGQTVTLENGILLNGGVTSSAYNGDAHALWLKAGAIVPKFELSGVLTATASVDGLTHTNTAYALDIASGASLPTLQIDAGGTVTASASGASANVTAIRDRSNTLTSITSKGYITASITGTDFNSDSVVDTVLNRAIAIDLSGNTVGATINLTDVADDTYNAPYITGDVKLGSGNDSIVLKGAAINGNIDFGAGANSLSLDKIGDIQASVLGKITSSGTVAIDVINGNLGLLEGSSLTVSNLHVGAASGLFLALNPDTPTTPMITGTGPVVFDNGASLKLSFSKIIQSPLKFTVLTGSSISLGNLNTNLAGEVPYLYAASLSTDAPKTTLYADFRLKTQAESGLSANEYGALGAVLTAAATDSGSTNALLAPLDKAGFLSVYSQFLPDYSGETFLTLAKGSQSLGRALSVQNRLPDAGTTQYWMQEYGFHVKRDHGDVTGYKATGFNFAGGWERALTGHQAGGMYTSITSSAPLDTYGISAERYSVFDFGVGGYWRLYNGPLKAWARLGAGYSKSEATREVLSNYVKHISESDWSGVSISGGLGASARYNVGPVSLLPLASLDYYSLKEDAHKETGGGTSFDLSIDERQSHMLSGRFQVGVGRKNTQALLQPEFWVGYQNNMAVKLDDTVARFTGGSDFRLNGLLKKGGGPLAGFRVAAENEYSHLSIEGEYEKQDDYTNVSVSLRARFQF